MKVFWNHDMLFVLEQRGLETEAWETQPGGQLTTGGTIFGLLLEINRRGRPSRNCGTPGKRARARMRMEMTVKYLCLVISVGGIENAMMMIYFDNRGFDLRHKVRILARLYHRLVRYYSESLYT